VLRGRRVSAERVEEVAHHYERFDGISPITELTMRQAQGLEAALAMSGSALPVYVGMRNWEPYLRETLARMSENGVRRAIGVIASAYRSYSGCLQYRENVNEARVGLLGTGLSDIEVTYVSDWHLSRGFIEANADHVLAALDALPAAVRWEAELVFTAHSIPVAMAQHYPYQRQLEESCAAVAAEVSRRVGGDDQPPWRLVFQSRSGRPEDPWLEPDIGDYLRDAAAQGARAVVLCPIGFICDHIEVLYDLDVEAAALARELGLPLTRASAVNSHTRFIDALREAVEETVRRYSAGRPVPVGIQRSNGSQ
jgi:protoporphyrin/coproporphyrin ferrochelatase